LQYRAPELCDLYRRLGISTKLDIWSLGVLLYKLCYFTTPFEEGLLSILNCRLSFPEEGRGDLNDLITNMIQLRPRKRPNIYQIVKRISELQNIKCPIQNIYQEEEEDNNESIKVVRLPKDDGKTMATPANQTPLEGMRRGRVKK
jgi:AP2-associated kinase